MCNGTGVSVGRTVGRTFASGICAVSTANVQADEVEGRGAIWRMFGTRTAPLVDRRAF